MIDMDKTEFLNLIQYVAELKEGIEKLYVNHKVVMSTSARNDLNRISVEELARNFTLPQLAEWQQGNQLMGIYSFPDYYGTLLASLKDVNDSQQLNQPTSIEKELTQEELNLVRKSQAHWDSFCNLFYHSIENVDTLKLILKNLERDKAQLLGREYALDENDIASFYNEKLDRLGTFLRQHIITLENISPVLSEETSSPKLKTRVTAEWFVDSLQQLCNAGYVSGAFDSDSALAGQWFDYALYTSQSNSGGRIVRIKWVGTSISLAQYVVTLCEAGVIIYKHGDRGLLYQWVQQCFDYSADENTMKKDLRNASNIQTQCFEVNRNPDGIFIFRIIHNARKAKGRK